MASLGALIIELAANTARLSGDMGKAVGIIERSAAKFKSAFKFLGIAGGGGIFGGVLAGVAKEAISFGDEIQKGATRAGIAAGEFSKLAAAAKQSDIDIGTLSKSLKAMQLSISGAAIGSKASTRALAELGIPLEKIKNLKADEQLALIAEQLAVIRDPADKARIGNELLGKSYLELMPLLEDGAEGLRKLRGEMGGITSEQAKALSDADAAIKRMNAAWSNFATTLTATVAPAIAAVLESMTPDKAGFGLLDRLEREEREMIQRGFDPKTLGALRERIAKLREELTKEMHRGGPSSRFTNFVNVGIDPEAEAEKKRKAKAEKEEKEFQKRMKELRAEFSFKDFLDDTNAGVKDYLSDFADENERAIQEANNIRGRYIQDWGKDLKKLSVYADEAARSMQSAFADFLFDPFSNGLKGMLKGFIDVIRRMVAEEAAAKIFGSKESGGFGLGGFLGGLFGSLGGGSKPALPEFAGGGRIGAMRPAIVGERGPELFLPGTSGSIVPNHALGGEIVINNYNVFNAGSDFELRKAMPALLNQQSDATVSRLRDMKRRGRF